MFIFLQYDYKRKQKYAMHCEGIQIVIFSLELFMMLTSDRIAKKTPEMNMLNKNDRNNKMTIKSL